MNEDVDLLLDRMRPDVDACSLGNSIDLESKYGQGIADVTRVRFFNGLFRRFEDSTLTSWMICLAFAWKDLSFDEWKRILFGLSDATDSLYGLIPFLTSFLGIDIAHVIKTDPSVPLPVRHYAELAFPKGGRAPGSPWVREMLEMQGIDVSDLWRRMAEQGAPMRREITL